MGLADGIAWEKEYGTTIKTENINKAEKSSYCKSCGKQDVCKYIDIFNQTLNNVNAIMDTPEANWFMSGDIRCTFYSKNINSR